MKTVHELGAYWFLEKPIQAGTLEVLSTCHNARRVEAEKKVWCTKARSAPW